MCSASGPIEYINVFTCASSSSLCNFVVMRYCANCVIHSNHPFGFMKSIDDGASTMEHQTSLFNRFCMLCHLLLIYVVLPSDSALMASLSEAVSTFSGTVEYRSAAVWVQRPFFRFFLVALFLDIQVLVGVPFIYFYLHILLLLFYFLWVLSFALWCQYVPCHISLGLWKSFNTSYSYSQNTILVKYVACIIYNRICGELLIKQNKWDTMI